MADITVQLNNAFLKAPQYIHEEIANKSKKTKSLFKDLIPSGKFEYGRGYFMKKNSFYGGKEITDSSGDWYQIKDSTNYPTDTHCQYDPPIVGYGFEEKKYTLYEATRRTEDICLRDLVFHWKFQQQMKLIIGSLADITLSAWEKWLRETYVTFSTKIICSEGFPAFTVKDAIEDVDGVVQNAGLRTIYLGESAGATKLPIDQIKPLSQDVLDYQYQYLARQAQQGATATSKNGMPVFTLVTSFETSTEIITRDKDRNEDMRYARPSFLLEGYGTVEGYKNWAHYHDLETPRYKVASNGVDLERVYPFEHNPSTIGHDTQISEEYVYAPFEISIVFLKDVFRGLIPENPTNVAGASFGGITNLGTFKWINIQDRSQNILGEIGFMFARFNAAPEPMDQVDNALCILHRRPNYTPFMQVNQGSDDSGAAAFGNIVSTSAVILADETGTAYTQVEVLLANPLTANIGDSVQFQEGDDTSVGEGVIAIDYATGRYRIRFQTAGELLVDLATATKVVVV